MRVAVGRRAVRVIRRGNRIVLLLRPQLTRLLGFRVGGVVSAEVAEHGALQLQVVRRIRARARFDARLPAARARTAGRAKRAPKLVLGTLNVRG